LHFVEFAKSSRPYPKVISAWIKGHPYWRNLENELFKEGQPWLFAEAAIKTILPNIHNPLISTAKTLVSRIVEASDSELITALLEKAERIGLKKFLIAFDFDLDRFGSPLLRASLERERYKFSREYIHIRYEGEEFLCVVSQMPEGLSPQRHQNAVWIFCLSSKTSALTIEQVVNSVTVFATETGTFPSVIRIVGRDLTELSEREGVLVLADPHMWGLAS
jgi:hypothetical protein